MARSVRKKSGTDTQHYMRLLSNKYESTCTHHTHTHAIELDVRDAGASVDNYYLQCCINGKACTRLQTHVNASRATSKMATGLHMMAAVQGASWFATLTEAPTLCETAVVSAEAPAPTNTLDLQVELRTAKRYCKIFNQWTHACLWLWGPRDVCSCS